VATITRVGGHELAWGEPDRLSVDVYRKFYVNKKTVSS
jgi:hypothetical protein